MLTIGVDVGGTFTDFVIYDESTEDLRTVKTPSTYPDPLQGALGGLEQLGIELRTMGRFAHGTTIGTNAILQRTGAKTAFITTKGFRDHVEIGDNLRYTGGLFDPHWERTRPLVPLPLRFEVQERIAADGTVIAPLHDEDVLATLKELRQQSIESVAVGFINSYRFPRHEKRVAELLNAHWPEIPYSLSADVVPNMREFPRFTTTILNAYIMPLLQDYMTKLATALEEAGYGGEILYMGSNAGVVTKETAAAYPVRLILSGPAAGVVASAYLGQLTARRNLITYDMGGTSTDVSLILDLLPKVSSKRVLQAYPIMTPMVDVQTVGAGGGRIVWVDQTNALRVGPQSAGASPGPACYGQGGVEFTITDANLILNRISPSGLLGGRMPVQRPLAEEAAQAVAAQVHMPDIHLVAEAAVRIAVANVAGAVRSISIERGHDPRECTLVAFGGAGPMHAIPVAEELQIPSVLVPRVPGNFCALGLLTSDLRHDFVRSYRIPLDEADLADVGDGLRDLAAQGHEALLRDGVAESQINVQHILSLRYLGQSWELDIPVSSAEFLPPEVKELFDEEHLKTYGYNRRGYPLELINLRGVAIGKVQKPLLRWSINGDGGLQGASRERRKVYFDGEFVDCPVYERDLLAPGFQLSGPAIIEETGSVTVVFPGWEMALDEFGNLLMERM